MLSLLRLARPLAKRGLRAITTSTSSPPSPAVVSTAFDPLLQRLVTRRGEDTLVIWDEESSGLRPHLADLGYPILSPGQRVYQTINQVELEVVRKLGWGGSSTVWLVRRLIDGKPPVGSPQYYALKALTQIDTSHIVRKMSHEEDAMAALKLNEDESHPGYRHCDRQIVCLRVDRFHLGRLLELHGSSLRALMAHTRSSPAFVKRIVRDVLLALTYLHDVAGLVHTDLKQDNIYVKMPREPGLDDAISAYIAAHPPEKYPPVSLPADIALDGAASVSVWRSQPIPDLGSTPLEERAIVVGDFGEAVSADEYQTWQAQPQGSRAPEIILGCPWSKPVDIWSVGCLTFAWLSRAALFPPLSAVVDYQGTMELGSEHLILDAIGKMRGPTAFSPAFLARCVMRDEYFDKSDGELHIETNFPSATVAKLLKARGVSPVEIGGAAAFIERCLTVDPEERPTAAELLQDPWLSDA